MEIRLDEISKTFGSQKVIDKLSYQFEAGKSYVILGGNGSGKSTLLQIILGSLTPSKGSVSYHTIQGVLKREEAAFKISMSSPYLELIEELSGLEFLNFYRQFRSFKAGFSAESVLEKARLNEYRAKQIRHYSSGMKQRLKLALAVLSENDVILLDEPASNLDPDGVAWYRSLIGEYGHGRTLIIGSNFDDREMDFCEYQLRITQD